MPESPSDLIPRTDPPQGQADSLSTPLPFGAASTDDAPTIISKNLVRPATAEEALNGLRGRRLAHFELLEAIGVGGMAAVLRARDTQLDRIVALKILPPEMANDPENIRRFHQEARSAAKLDHENIARVFYCGEDQRLHFIAFEFVEGDNLRTILDKRGRLPVGEALHYMVQVAAGLNHAAARGVVHRDIKPSNIIITPHSRAKLVDMGLARDLATRADKGLTQSGVTLGTFDYISPEQALEPREADVRSDIYSLGCTFYHMLTGVAPVPEGTAAKKLHHHQHVKPTDPRELAPNIPDQVAMILARMMAKNPRDRYQSPEQLVHDLLGAMRQLGTGGNVPEGVLAVEASLPPAPSYRPIIFVAASIAAVVALVLVLAPTVAPTQRGDGKRPTPVVDLDKQGPATNQGEGTPKDPPKDPPKEPPKEPPIYSDLYVTADRLAAWLKEHDNADEITIELAHDIDWQVHDDDRGLLVRAKKVTIRPMYPDRRVTIRLSYSGAKLPPQAALTIDSREATVEGLRVVLDSSSVSPAMTGLHIMGQPDGRYRVERCEFIQAREEGTQRLASVVLDARPSREAARSFLTLNECVFLGFEQQGIEVKENTWRLLLQKPYTGGQDAVVRRGAGQITATNCAFGPHAVAFRFEGGSDTDDTTITHCSFMAGSGSKVFFFQEEAAAALTVRSSLFCGLRSGEQAADNGACLISKTDAHSTALYHGADNRYYHLDGFLTSDDRTEGNYENFVRKLTNDAEMAGPLSGEDEKSRVLTESPWVDATPLKRLEDMHYVVQFDGKYKAPGEAQRQEEQQVADAFQVKRDQRDLRAAGDPTKHLIGVERLFNSIAFTDNLEKLTDKKPDPVVRRKLIVDPSLAMSEKGTYTSLQQAINEAKPGDLILIRHTGKLAVKPIRLEDPGIDLTIRAYGDEKPVLVMGATSDVDASLFRLHDGKLRLENLEFRLQPAQRDFRSHSVAALIGDGQCTFKDCVITLDPGSLDTPLAVVTLVDNGDVMKMKNQPPGTMSQPPRLVFDNCFVRGNGDLLWDRVGRPLLLDLRDSLVALQGNVVNVEAPETNASGTAPANVAVTTNHTTAYVSGYFVRLKGGKELKGLGRLECKASGSLFVAAVTGQPFVHLDGPAADKEDLKKKLIWSGEQNVYGGYTEMLNQHPAEDDTPPPPIMKDEWPTFTSDDKPNFVRMGMVKFPSPGETPFIRMTPGLFKQMDITAGADVQGLPKPGNDDH